MVEIVLFASNIEKNTAAKMYFDIMVSPNVLRQGLGSIFLACEDKKRMIETSIWFMRVL